MFSEARKSRIAKLKTGYERAAIDRYIRMGVDDWPRSVADEEFDSAETVPWIEVPGLEESGCGREGSERGQGDIEGDTGPGEGGAGEASREEAVDYFLRELVGEREGARLGGAINRE